MLYSQAELQAFVFLVNRMTLNPAEQQFIQMFVNRLVAFCAPQQSEEPESTLKTPPETSEATKA